MKNFRMLALSCSMVSWFALGSLSPLSAYEIISVDHGGSVSGTVKVKGVAPSGRTISVTKNPEVCGQTVPDESIVVNSNNKGLKNVLVYIENIQKGKKNKPTDLLVHNQKCRFEIHVQGGMSSDSFTVKNSDSIMHNTHLHTQDKTSVINVAMPPGGKEIHRPVGENRGLIDIKCDVHKFMRGWIRILDNPYFSVTDEDGNFNITDVPPGNYKLKFWHETVSIPDKDIAVISDKTGHLLVEAPVE